MKKIGITGGIGSGKSLVCRLFSMLGIPVYSADEEARKIMHQPPLKEELAREFGNIYNENGDLDRKLLASRVFNDAGQLKKLNSIVHPYVIRHYRQWESAQSAPFVLRESAILFESGTDAGLDEVISVSAPENVRIKRVMQRDHRTESEVKAIISRQMPDIEKEKKSSYVIVNDNQAAVLPQVWNIYTAIVNG